MIFGLLFIFGWLGYFVFIAYALDFIEKSMRNVSHAGIALLTALLTFLYFASMFALISTVITMQPGEVLAGVVLMSFTNSLFILILYARERHVQWLILLITCILLLILLFAYFLSLGVYGVIFIVAAILVFGTSFYLLKQHLLKIAPHFHGVWRWAWYITGSFDKDLESYVRTEKDRVWMQRFFYITWVLRFLQVFSSSRSRAGKM